jgi:hypothetical protein
MPPKKMWMYPPEVANTVVFPEGNVWEGTIFFAMLICFVHNLWHNNHRTGEKLSPAYQFAWAIQVASVTLRKSNAVMGNPLQMEV